MASAHRLEAGVTLLVGSAVKGLALAVFIGGG